MDNVSNTNNQSKQAKDSSTSLLKVCMLSTEDNPFDPFDDYDRWNAFDVSKGYNSASYLARIAYTSDDFTAEQQALAIEQAIDEIVVLNLSGNYVKLSRFM